MADPRPEMSENNQTTKVAEERAALERLDMRINAARDDLKPKTRSGASKYHSLSLAWRMVLELVIGFAIGAGLGHGLDLMLGTGPWLLILFGALGLAAGVKTMFASAKEVSRQMKQQESAAGGRAVGE